MEGFTDQGSSNLKSARGSQGFVLGINLKNLNPNL
jgi:hypothetical protein